MEDTETVGARVVAGLGEVEARTWYTLSTVVPLTVQEKQYTGEEILAQDERWRRA